MTRGRPKSNKDAEIERLYNEGYNVEEIAEQLSLKASTVKQKLTEKQLYDPPITEHFVKKIWGEWERACSALKGEQMKIKLTGDYYITRDQYNWMLNKRRKIEKGKRAGEYTYTTVGYYGKLRACIIGFLDKISLDETYSGDYDLMTYVEHCERAMDDTADYIVAHIEELIET